MATTKEKLDTLYDEHVGDAGDEKSDTDKIVRLLEELFETLDHVAEHSHVVS